MSKQELVIYCYNSVIAQVVHDTLVEFGYVKRSTSLDITSKFVIGMVSTTSSGAILFKSSLRARKATETLIDLKDVADRMAYQPTEVEL